MRKLFVCLAMVCQLMCYAQTAPTVEALEFNIDLRLDKPSERLLQLLSDYVKQNVLNLKSIEGEFHLTRNIIPGESSLSIGITQSKPIVSPSVWIYYSKKRNKYYQIGAQKSENKETAYVKELTIIPQSSNTYIMITEEYGQNEIRNPNNFTVIVQILPRIATVKDTYVKKYPTEETYRQAAMQAATPQEWSGTGFALKNGYLITNHHVIDGAGSISVQGVNGNFITKLTATVVASDQANDIALLKITDGRFTGFGNVPYQLRTTMAEVGEEVFALGYPLADVMGDEIKFTDGKISSRTGVQGAVNVYQISVPIQPGNSGGPLFDQQGRVVGITTASLNKDVFDAENVNYAVKTNYILNLIDSSVGRGILPTGALMGNMGIPQKIKTVKNFVFFIKCKK